MPNDSDRRPGRNATSLPHLNANHSQPQFKRLGGGFLDFGCLGEPESGRAIAEVGVFLAQPWSLSAWRWQAAADSRHRCLGGDDCRARGGRGCVERALAGGGWNGARLCSCPCPGTRQSAACHFVLTTAGFGVGQIAGAVVAGLLLDRTGSYAVASLLTAWALVVAALTITKSVLRALAIG